MKKTKIKNIKNKKTKEIYYLICKINAFVATFQLRVFVLKSNKVLLAVISFMNRKFN